MSEDLLNQVASPIFQATQPLNMRSTDAEEMKEQSALGNWSYEHKQYGRGKFHGSIFSTNTPRLQLSLTHRGGIYIRDGIPSGATVISLAVYASKPAICRGKTIQSNHAVALKNHEEFEYVSTEPTTLLTIACSSQLVEQKALETTGQSFDSLRMQDQLMLKDSCYSNRVKRLLSLLHAYHYQTEGLCSEEGIYLENQVLETVFNGVLARQDPSRHKHSLIHAKKAEDYIRANLRNNLSINDICLATGTTERTLHLGFKERYGVSPSAYILIMKLNEVRKDLRRHSFHHSVTDIALRCGFNHLGRFAEQYRLFFGELPSDTIKSKNR